MPDNLSILKTLREQKTEELAARYAYYKTQFPGLLITALMAQVLDERAWP